jgi:hypothetical protein
MKTVGEEHREEIKTHRATALRLLNEANWIRQEFFNLPFLKRQYALKALFALKTEARAALREALSLKVKKTKPD